MQRRCCPLHSGGQGRRPRQGAVALPARPRDDLRGKCHNTPHHTIIPGDISETLRVIAGGDPNAHAEDGVFQPRLLHPRAVAHRAGPNLLTDRLLLPVPTPINSRLPMMSRDSFNLPLLLGFLLTQMTLL